MVNKKKTADIIALENAVPDEPVVAFTNNIDNKDGGDGTINIGTSEVIPAMTDPGWSDFVMKQFTEDEIYDGNPTVDGLRRLAEKYVGEIIDSKAHSVAWPVGPGRDNCCATVEFTVVFLTNSGVKTYTEVADVTTSNTEELYRMYPSATASTRAEGRALRKALKLKRVVAAEEVKELSVEEVENSNEKIKFSQVQYLKNVGRQIDVDVIKFVNSGSRQYKTYKEIPQAKAAEMIRTLSGFKTDMSKIPAQLKGYKEGWDQ